MKRLLAAVGLLGAGLLLQGPVQAQTAQETYKTYPQVPGLAGRVLNQETNFWLRGTAMPFLEEPMPQRDEILIRYQDRQGKPISQDAFLDEVRQVSPPPRFY